MSTTCPGRSSVNSRRPAERALLALPAGLCLVAGIDAGLGLLRAWPPVPSARLGEVHGILMVAGFIGTLIALERAVAWGRRAGYLAPALLGLGGLLLILHGSATAQAAGTLLPAGALALCLLYVPLWRRQRDDAVLVSSLGAVSLLGGLVLWRGGVDTALAVPWLVGFVVLTIAGERLELARFGMTPAAARVLVLLGFSMAWAVVVVTLWPRVGAALLGWTLLGLAGWMLAHDVARRTARSSGLPRFAGWCMLSGQAWLAVAGAAWLAVGPVAAGPAYDVVVHAVFLGFAMSMILAHAPTILPAVARVDLPYRTAMWAPWVLLQASLLLRLWVGDALDAEWARRVGGLGNALAVALFLIVTVGSVVMEARTGRRQRRVQAGAR